MKCPQRNAPRNICDAAEWVWITLPAVCKLFSRLGYCPLLVVCCLVSHTSRSAEHLWRGRTRTNTISVVGCPFSRLDPHMHCSISLCMSLHGFTSFIALDASDRPKQYNAHYSKWWVSCACSLRGTSVTRKNADKHNFSRWLPVLMIRPLRMHCLIPLCVSLHGFISFVALDAWGTWVKLSETQVKPK